MQICEAVNNLDLVISRRAMRESRDEIERRTADGEKMASLKDLNVQFGEYVQLDELQESQKKARARSSATLTLEHGVGGGFILCSDFSPLRRRWYLLKCSAP